MAQTWVSKLENPDYGKMTVATLLRLAEAFDTDLEIKFRSFSTTLDTLPKQGPEYFSVPSFEHEKGEIETKIAREEADAFASISLGESALEKWAHQLSAAAQIPISALNSCPPQYAYISGGQQRYIRVFEKDQYPSSPYGRLRESGLPLSASVVVEAQRKPTPIRSTNQLVVGNAA
jgi:hypothetical protein